MERQIAAFNLLGRLLPDEQRRELAELEREQYRITKLVDSFYVLLGSRNWVFTGDLNMTAVEYVVDTDDPTVAEARLIAYYKEDDRIAFPLGRLRRFEAMRPRIGLLTKALTDYHADRHYSTVLVLLSVMDGFVNDLEKDSRRGLHSRPAEDMVAWDSVVGHHLGLSHAHESFLKGFYKTDESEVTELFRNGIMHGMLVGFDNDVVATKAWNRLFAVTDWADSRERQAEPVAPAPSLGETFAQRMDLQRKKKLIEQWQPYDYEPGARADEQTEMTRTCVDFLRRWEKRQWHPLGLHFMPTGTAKTSAGKLAQLAKDLYGNHGLSSWAIQRVRHVAAAVAHTDVDVVVDGVIYRTELRWVRVDDVGDVVIDSEPGRWTLSLYGPSHFLKPDNANAT